MVNTYKILAMVIFLQIIMGIITTAASEPTNTNYNEGVKNIDSQTEADKATADTKTGIWANIVNGALAIYDLTVGNALKLGGIILKYIYYFTIGIPYNPITETNQVKALLGYILIGFRSVLSISLIMLLYDKFKNKKYD